MCSRITTGSNRLGAPDEGVGPGRSSGKGLMMGLSFTVGGMRGTFDEPFANEVAGLLDHAFGAEGDWEGVPPLHFGELIGSGWTDLQRRAVDALGSVMVPNLLALGDEGRGV